MASGDTDVLPMAFEFEAIRFRWDSVREYLCRLDLDSYASRADLRCLTPKGRNGFRIVTELDPYDTLILTALVHDLGPSIEDVRSGPAAVVSYRFDPDEGGRLYDESLNHRAFVERSVELAESHPWVVMTDIADFFPRIYSHRLENMLDHAESDAFLTTPSAGVARALKKLLKSWNQNISRGIPVGPSATRILADLAITNVDRALTTSGIRYVRYSDDFRLYAQSEREAYRMLAFLAEQLDVTQGLTLQAAKTYVLSAIDFISRFGETAEGQLEAALTARIDSVRSVIGAGDYDLVSMRTLTAAEESELRRLQLFQILEAILASAETAEVDQVKVIVDAIATLALPDEQGLLIDGAERFPSLFRHFINAWGRQARLGSPTDFRRLRLGGERLLALLDTSNFGHLPYHRAWVLEQTTRTPFICDSSAVARATNGYSDELTTRYAAMAMWAQQEYSWFQSRRNQFNSMPPWIRRAFLVGTTCLPGDEASHFHRAVGPSLDHLENVVPDWAKTNEPNTWRRSLAS